MLSLAQPATPFAIPHALAGRSVLKSLLDLAAAVAGALTEASPALSGRLRGAGPGVSFTGQIGILERDHPIELVFPFEGCELVGGAAWRGSDLLTPPLPSGIAKLHWRAGAGGLPMHTHPTSDRFIVVLEGRGFFHCSRQPIDQFDGAGVRTIAARSGDVFAFRRGVVHTFSTTDHGMTLISCHLPFLELDDPAQYALPSFRWTACEQLKEAPPPPMVCGGWEPLA
jgi:mannose-6-phosphate isomerase-like protein (cupin superfamily)